MPLRIAVDRPFLFLIRDKQTDCGEAAAQTNGGREVFFPIREWGMLTFGRLAREMSRGAWQGEEDSGSQIEIPSRGSCHE